MPREYDVAQVRRAMPEKLGAHRPDANPSASGKLEILGDASIENKSLARIAGIYKLQCVPQAIEAFLVEHGACQFRLAPIAGSDAGTSQARFGLFARLHQL